MTVLASAARLSAGSWPVRLRAVTVAVVAGVTVGIPLALLARTFMRITALMAGGTGTFSVEGSVGVVVAVVGSFAVPAALGCTGIRGRLPIGGRRPVAFAVLAFLAIGVPYAWAAPMGLNTTGDPWINRVMYSSLPAVGGYGIPFVIDRIDARLPVPRSPLALAVSVLVSLIAVASCLFATLLAVLIVRGPS